MGLDPFKKRSESWLALSLTWDHKKSAHWAQCNPNTIQILPRCNPNISHQNPTHIGTPNARLPASRMVRGIFSLLVRHPVYGTSYSKTNILRQLPSELSLILIGLGLLRMKQKQTTSLNSVSQLPSLHGRGVEMECPFQTDSEILPVSAKWNIKCFYTPTEGKEKKTDILESISHTLKPYRSSIMKLK